MMNIFMQKGTEGIIFRFGCNRISALCQFLCDLQGLKCNFNVVGKVKKSLGPYRNLWAPFNFAAGPLYF